jgi:hypothetical protein
VSALGDRGLVARAGVALVLANAQFWPKIAPLVRGELKRWEHAASRIEDEGLRRLALEKLREEHFNSEVAATLATLAPARLRKPVVEAIVAYEVLYDYLDGRTEIPTPEPLRHGRELYRAFTDAVTLDTAPAARYDAREAEDEGYLAELVSVVRRAIVQLPTVGAISQRAQAAAGRCAEAQLRAHAVPQLGTGQLEDWAATQAEGTSLGWRQFMAGSASSVLAVHALIASAANERTTSTEANEIDTVYLSICALSTMLDSLVDYERDQAAGQQGYIRFYEDHEMLAQDLAESVRRAIEHAAPLPDGAHHIMTLVGVAAYYLSAPTADSDFARPVAQSIRRELQPLMTPTLAVMQTWRLAKRTKSTLESSGLE